MKNFYLSLCLSLATFASIAQNSTLIVYDLATQQFDTLPAVTDNSTLTAAKTVSSVGILPGLEALPVEAPDDSLFPGTQHSFRQKADLFYDLSSYPARAAVKLFYINDVGDTLPFCSGLMVDDNHVLTAAHCLAAVTPGVMGTAPKFVAPSFDDGVPHPDLPMSAVSKSYVFEGWSAGGSIYNDVGLLELETPIGNEIGWMSIGFQDDDAWYEGKNFHKFSFPNYPNQLGHGANYTGDSMYYSYGRLDFFLADWLGVLGYKAGGVGESGSSWFYSDNDYNYVSFGVSTYLNNSRHSRITRERFLALNAVIGSDLYALTTPPVGVEEAVAEAVTVYPNPTAGVLQVTVANANNGSHYVLRNALGQVVESNTLVPGTNTLTLAGQPAGLYLLETESTSGKTVTKVVKR